MNTFTKNFPLVRANDGTPCIIGNTYEKFRSNCFNVKVVRSNGDKAGVYQHLADKDTAMYKIRGGDYISCYDSNIFNSTLMLCRVTNITDTEIITEIVDGVIIIPGGAH